MSDADKRSISERLQDVGTRLKDISVRSSEQRQKSEMMLQKIRAKKVARNGTAADLASKH